MAVKRILLAVGSGACTVMVLGGVFGAAGAGADPASTPDPSLPTLFTNPETYVVQGDGRRVDCTSTLTFCWPSHD